VFLKILKLWKSFSADIADVRFDFVVNVFEMAFDQTFSVKRLAAFLASVDFLLTMNRIAVIPVLTLTEGFVTFLAILSLRRVVDGSDVTSQPLHVDEDLRADLTHDALGGIINVLFVVTVEKTFRLERFGADLALVALLIVVVGHVSLEKLSDFEISLTNVTSKRPGWKCCFRWNTCFLSISNPDSGLSAFVEMTIVECDRSMTRQYF
jgi:hypothetical protein